MTGKEPAAEGERSAAAMREHPDRRRAVGEMHLRRWPGLAAPCLVIQWIRVVTEADKAAQHARLQDKASGDSLLSAPGGRHISGHLSDDIRFVWEGHSEASSLTCFMAVDDASLFLEPMNDPDLREAISIAEQMPGEIIRATRILVVPDETAAENILRDAGFFSSDLVSCHIGEGARLWSDFRIKDDSYGRLLLAGNGLPASDLSRLVQRLQELGNYRNLALLGLPLAQSHWPRLNRAEELLRAIAQDEVRMETRDDDLLARTSELSLELMSLATDSSYRMSATAAYARLVEDRLAELNVRPIAGFLSLVDFTQRRFIPAARTCAAFMEREKQLSLRAAQFTSLLRARIETRIENQNAQLLASMERSAGMQLRLQQLVEGFSVVALSYYSLALIEKLLLGAEKTGVHVDAHLAVAILTLPTVALVWIAVKLLKKRVLK